MKRLAGPRKEFELLFKLKASLGSDFNSAFKGAMETQKKLQDSLKSVNSLQGKVDGYNKTSNAISQQNEKLTRLQTEHQKIAQKIQMHEQHAERLRAKIEETGDATGELTAQLAREENEVQKNTERLKSNESQIRQTTASIQQQTQQLNRVGEELREAGVNTDNLEESNARLQRSYERLQNSQQTIQRLNQAQQNINESISHTKTQLVGTVGVMAAAGAAIYNGPVKKAAEFQEQMSTVQAISGATGDDLKLLSEKAKEMGATTKFTAKEAGQAMEYMAMAGWKTKDMMGGIEGVMNLAAASGEELAAVSDIVTDAMTAFGMSADGTTNGVSNATHFADVLAQASSNANTNVGMMGETFKYVAPVAGSLGYSLEDTATMIGVMANSGIKASNAGTALRSIMTRLSTDAGASSKSLGALGILTKKLGVEFYDSKGKTRDLAKVIGETREAWKGLTQEEQNNYAKKIAGQSGISGWLSLMNAEQKDFDKLTKSIQNADGAAEEMAKKKLDNFAGQVTLFQSAFDGLQTELGLMVLPKLTEAVKKITEVTSAASKFVNKNPETVKMIAKIAAGLVGLKAGGLVAKIGFLHLQNGFLGIRKAFTLIKGVGLSRYISALTNGFGGLAGAAKGIMSYFKGIGSAAGGVASAFGNIFANSSVFSKLGGVMKNAGLKMMGFMLKPFSMFGTRLSGVLANVAGVIARSPIGTIGTVIGKGFGKITAFIAPVGNAIKTLLGPLGKLTTSIFGPLGGVVGKVLPIVGVITAIITAVQLVKSHLQEIRGFIQKTFGDGALAVFDKVVAVITNIGNTVKGVFTKGLNGAGELIGEKFGVKGELAVLKLAAALIKIKNAAGQFVEFVTTHIVPVIEQVFNVLMTSVIPGIISGIQAAAPVIMQIFQAIAEFIAGIIPVIGSFIAELMPIISQIISFIQTNVLPIISSIFQFIVSTVLPAIVSGIQQLGSIITTVLSAALPVVQTVFTTIWNIIQPIMQMILQVVQAVLPEVQAVFKSVFDAIGGVISGFREVLSGIIQFITGVFSGNWSAAWNGIKSIFSGVWESIKSIAKGVMDGISHAVQGVMDGIGKVKETIGGVGGKIAKTLHIPGFAKGSTNTPDTFIAGENGPELITNAPGRTVYTAQQTKGILKAQNQVRNAAAAVQATGTTNIINNNAPENVPGESEPELRIGTGRSSITVTINNKPTIYVDGGKPGDLEEKLEENNRCLLQKVKELFDKLNDDERRSVYE